MKIGLYNLQPRYKNLSLEKVRKYYTDKGYTVSNCTPIEAKDYDIVYASSIFDWTPQDYITDKMITGGTGFNLTTILEPEIHAVEPHLNFGFTTRGCMRNCEFCVVPQKEGKLRISGDLNNLWDRKSKLITLYDNNILGIPQHFSRICHQAREYNLTLDFNQGLDHRLLTPEVVDLMKSIKHKEYKFAFDHPSYINSVDKAITLLKSKGINRCNWYVLVGYNTTFKEDLERLHYLKSRNQNAFVQKFRKKGMKKLPQGYTALARWCNNHSWFQGLTWEQFLNRPENNYTHLVSEVVRL